MQDCSALRTKPRAPALSSSRKVGTGGEHPATPQGLLARCHSPLSPSSLMKMPPWRIASSPERGQSSPEASARSAGTPVLGRPRKHPSPAPLGSGIGGADAGAFLPRPTTPFQPAMPSCANPLSCLLQGRRRRGGEPILEVAGHNLKRLPAGGVCEGLLQRTRGRSMNPSSDVSQTPQDCRCMSPAGHSFAHSFIH